MVKDSEVENQKTLQLLRRMASIRPTIQSKTVASKNASPELPGRHQNVPHFNVATSDKFNPVFWFKNADEPVPPDDYKPNDKRRIFKWNMRNPFHNFTYYVIGMADKPFIRTGKHAAEVFNPEGGWNWAVCKYRWVRLPFISYQKGSFKFYFGWRERGNFGIKLTF
jgi:hypothetical protein